VLWNLKATGRIAIIIIIALDEEDIEDFAETEFVLNFGCGMILAEKYHIEIRYSLGMTNLVTGDLAEDFEVKSRSIQLMAGMSPNLSADVAEELLLKNFRQSSRTSNCLRRYGR